MTEIITTAEELDALPIRSIAIDEDGDAYQKFSDGWRAAFCDPDPEEAFDLPERLTLVHRPDHPAPSLPPTMEQITAVIMGHRPSRWRSFSNDAEILRCCGIDFGTATKKLKPGEDGGAWTSWSSHVAEAVHKLYPTCQPSREVLAEALDPWVVTHHHGCHGDDDWGSSLSTKDGGELADTALALLPGRSEAEVKAEARREVLEWISSGYQTIGGLTTIDQVLSGLADPDNPPFGCAAGGEQ